MYDRILVPIDGSATSTRAAAEAGRLAKLCSARLRLLHVIDMGEHSYGYETPEAYSQTRSLVISAAKQLLSDTRARLAETGVVVEVELVESFGAQVSAIIVAHAVQWDADLIMLGTHGRRGIQHVLMGSDAERVARTSPIPVLLVKQRQEKIDDAHPAPARVIAWNELEDAV